VDSQAPFTFCASRHSVNLSAVRKKGGDLFDRRLFVEGLKAQRILPP
jgi:hypothetical protein